MEPRRNPYSDVSKDLTEAVKTMKSHLFQALEAMLVIDQKIRYIRGWEDRLVRIYQAERERDQRGNRPTAGVEPQPRQEEDPDRDRDEGSTDQGGSSNRQHYSDIDSDSSVEEGNVTVNGHPGFVVRDGDTNWYGN